MAVEIKVRKIIFERDIIAPLYYDFFVDFFCYLLDKLMVPGLGTAYLI